MRMTMDVDWLLRTGGGPRRCSATENRHCRDARHQHPSLRSRTPGVGPDRKGEQGWTHSPPSPDHTSQPMLIPGNLFWQTW